jgi:hypothetical protein
MRKISNVLSNISNIFGIYKQFIMLWLHLSLITLKANQLMRATVAKVNKENHRIFNLYMTNNIS